MGNHCFCSGFCLLVIVLLCCSLVIGGRNIRDQQALLEIKAKIADDPFGVLSSWNMSLHFCQWQGVVCGHKHRRVTILDLRSQRLMGSISPSLGNLSFLRVLNLQDNELTGEIPAEVGNLRRLQIMRFNNNSLSGQIPDNISGCSNLIIINLGFNSLVGKIPGGFSSLLKLRLLILQYNNLTGEIPPFFGNFSSLEVISMPVNNFVGSIPETLGNLNKLHFFAMGTNMLSGTIPPSLYNVSSITQLSFLDNQLRGTLPSELGNNIFPNLATFVISNNHFTGPIPLSLSNASNLGSFFIGGNEIRGNVPSLEKLHKLSRLSIRDNQLGTGQGGDLNFLSTINNGTSLELLAISRNNFGGVLPSSIANFSSLKFLMLDFNRMIGNIPAGLENLVNLETLYLGNNQLTNEIPEEIGKLKELRILNLAENDFSGKVPPSFGNLTRLTHLYMNQNNLWGSIPPSLGKCQNLLLLTLDDNNLSGEIPKEVISIPSLAIYMGLSHNNFTGSLPPEVGKLTNLGTLDISGNMLFGEIPRSLGSCESLEFLYMHHNFFQGIIPSSLRSLKAIQELDFSQNNLTGKIPKFLEDLRLLLMLNLSFNDFEGQVPEVGVFKNSSAISVAGNSKLCGGIIELMLPPCQYKDTTKGRFTLAVKLVIAACGLLFAALITSFLFLLFIKRKRAKPDSSSSVNQLLLISYQSLLKATNGFSSTNLLGMGSFGSVYKGKIDTNGVNVAVKVLNLLNPSALKSFKAECEVLRNVKHRNLVKILTACSSIDYQGNDFKALVYEFMVNGSLDEWLHSIQRANDEEQETTRSLNFLQRLNIVIDIASAVEYLHQGCQTPIIHCDLKPSNVLLDEDMVGHVGDFGLSKFFAEAVQNNSAIQSNSIGVRGTVGYMAPEYGLGSEVSTSGDVYAFGVLVLEIFTGKRPTDEMFKDTMSLHTYAKAALQEQLVAKILDPIVFLEINEDGSNNDPNSKSYIRNNEIKECITTIFEIGVACSAEMPSDRMNISVVANELQAIKRFLK